MIRFLILFAFAAFITFAPVAQAGDDLLPPKQDKPLTDFSKAQLGTQNEVSKKFGTKVDQTILDRGDGDVQQRDRLGQGRVGVFYDHRKDERLQDTDDTIGVQIKLFDLNE